MSLRGPVVFVALDAQYKKRRNCLLPTEHCHLVSWIEGGNLSVRPAAECKRKSESMLLAHEAKYHCLEHSSYRSPVVSQFNLTRKQ